MASEALSSKTQSPSLWSRIGDQLGGSLLREYLIAEETNNFWYALGGILTISIILQFITGFILLFKYIPDAALAYGITVSLIKSPAWHTILNFHYWNSYVMFALLMLHLMRVFISGAYRGKKTGLWLVGVILAGLIFAVYITGESLHWDEVGFAVPWHTSEFFQAIHLEHLFSYTFAELLAIPTATGKLVQIYGLHVAILPIIIALVMIYHFYLIKEKGISLPCWTKPSGEKAPFIKHMKVWFFWSAIIFGVVLLISAFVPRDPGIPPQLIPSSPFYGLHGGPGHFHAKPTFPISWTHGMNVFVGEHLGIEPDIWGTIIGMTLLLCALLFVPFVDRGEREPASCAEAFAWKTRKWAFLLIALFWMIFLIGAIQNALAGPG